MEKMILYIKQFLFENTTAEFEAVPCTDKQWSHMKGSIYNTSWSSPSGYTEFILTDDWYIWRKPASAPSGWPCTSNGCRWSCDENTAAVAKCHITDFIKNT
jgi:hypothetical protein